MDDLDALAHLALRLGPVQVTALISRLAAQAPAWPQAMAANQAAGGQVKGDWASPHWDMELVIALRTAADRAEGAWAATRERRQRWNACLGQFHERYHQGALRELSLLPDTTETTGLRERKG